MDSNYSETRVIGFKGLCVFLLLSFIILPVFVMYSGVYWLKRNDWHKGWRRFVIVIPVFIFVIVNTFHNWTVCTILFWEFPREFQTTTRLRRMKTNPDKSKRELADLMGGFLNSQDPNHY